MSTFDFPITLADENLKLSRIPRHHAAAWTSGAIAEICSYIPRAVEDMPSKASLDLVRPIAREHDLEVKAAVAYPT